MDRLGDKVCCNPTVKLKKGEYYPLIDIEKIAPRYKTVRNQEEIVFNGQSCTKFEDRDVLFARITPCLENGKIAMADTNGKCGIGSTELFVFRGIEGISNTDYVYYLLRMDYIRQLAANSMTGASGRQRADLNFIKKIKWQFPVIEQQQKIASILSAYDDLIENNNKRIKNLEQMAENLYKEWFVRFRFPDYQNTEFENGIPKGWKIKRIVDYGKIETGKTPSTMFESYYGADIMFVKTPDMTGNIFTCQTSEYLSVEGHSQQPTKLLPANSIMVSCIGSAGVVSINSEPAHTNQQINSIILHDTLHLEWLYFTCKSLKNTIEMFGATGATMTNLSKGKFEKLKVVDPPSQIIELYHDKTSSIFIKIKSLLYINQNLIKQRDMLLPRLMSGKLEV